MLPRDRVRTSPAPCTTTALQENEYEIHNRHAFAHDICHNRCGCAGWKRAWPPQLAAAGHRHATAGTCANDFFADKAAVEAFPAQVGISFNDEIAANRSRQGLRSTLRRDESDRSRLETRPLIQMQRSPWRSPQWFQGIRTPVTTAASSPEDSPEESGVCE